MIPRGFAEIRAIEHPPVIAREYLARGAVVKYIVSKPIEIAGKHGAIDFLMVHEFQARAGFGLSFRLAGTPDLNAKMWAVRPGWTLWLQYMGIEQVDPMLAADDRHAEHLWHVGGVMDIGAFRELLRVMEPDHRALDHGIAVEAGILRAADLGVLGISDEDPIALLPTSIEEPRKTEDRPELPTVATVRRKPYSRKPLVAESRDLSDEDLDLPPVDRAARPIHALLRSLLKDGAKPREFVEQKMQEAGFSRRQVNRAREAVGVVARRRGVKGRRGGGVWLLELPGPGKHRTITRTADVVKLARVSSPKGEPSIAAVNDTHRRAITAAGGARREPRSEQERRTRVEAREESAGRSDLETEPSRKAARSAPAQQRAPEAARDSAQMPDLATGPNTEPSSVRRPRHARVMLAD